MDLKVADISNNNGKWNLDQIVNVIPENYLKIVETLPPPNRSEGPDRKILANTKDGSFSIAAAYSRISGFPSLTPDHAWNLLWKIDAPERIRCFIWQLAHGRLPTKVLCSKWSNTNPNCKHCPDTPETLLHVFRDCSKATPVWQATLGQAHPPNFYTTNLKDWVLLNFNQRDNNKHLHPWQTVWATTCYHLWTWRNRDEHDPNFQRPFKPDKEIQGFINAYFASQTGHSAVISKTLTQIQVKWTPPTLGWISINCDGAFNGREDLAACGGVLRDEQGNWIMGFTKKIGVASAFVAELWGVFCGLQIARDLGFTKVELRVDSTIVIKSISPNSGNVSGRHLIRRINGLCSTLGWTVIRKHEFREANAVADGLAKLGLSNADNTLINLYPTPPNCIKQLVALDSHGVSTPRLVTM